MEEVREVVARLSKAKLEEIQKRAAEIQNRQDRDEDQQQVIPKQDPPKERKTLDLREL